jgi:thiol-disulfide isomerase/thioredoxin/uncharacterized membrane protein
MPAASDVEHRMSAAGPGWRGVRSALTLLLASGILVSTLLTYHHENRMYGDATAVLANCPNTETVNCETVNTSAWSELFGIPIAAFAIPTYLLVLILLWSRREAARLLAYAFCIGILTTFYSLFLFYVSSTKIGFICLYCVSLYGVNVAIPLLTLAAARRSPLSMIRETFSDLVAWPRTLRVTAGLFVALLLSTVGVQEAYRVHVRRAAAEERERIEQEGGPLVPAGPTSRLREPSLSVEPIEPMLASLAPVLALPAATAAPVSIPRSAYVVPGPLRKVETAKGAAVSAPFDLQGRLGKGKPVALLFWAPGFRDSERTLVGMAAYFRRTAPGIEVDAVAGKGSEERDEEILETYTMLGLPREVPLLIDDGFVVSRALNTEDVPDVALFDGKGALVVSKIKDLGQQLVVASARVTAAEVIRRVASGIDVPPIELMAQYYPATELHAHCAPPFTLRKFDSDEIYSFKGKSASGRPTLVVFWSSVCKHCQIEIPLLVSWARKNPGRVDIVSVTRIKADRESGMNHREVTRKYIKALGIPWVVLEDPDGAVTDLYRSISTPTSYFVTPGGTIVDTWFHPHPDDFDAAIAKQLDKLKAAPAAAACAPAPESPAPRMAFDMLDPEGKKVSLSSQLDRPAVVHLWATWCAPCVEEIPALLKFGSSLEKSGDGRLVMVSVEDAGSGGKIAEFEKKLNLTFRSNRAPTGGLADGLDLSYRLPRTYVVGPGGAVLSYRAGSQKWDDPAVDEKVLSRLRNAAWLAK